MNVFELDNKNKNSVSVVFKIAEDTVKKCYKCADGRLVEFPSDCFKLNLVAKNSIKVKDETT